MTDLVTLAGADGCRAGWVYVEATLMSNRLRVGRRVIVSTFAELLERIETPAVIAVDIPIGLPECAEPGGRACDRAARARLGPRAMSVFSAPVRAVLRCATYAEALAASRASSEHGLGLSKQAWNLVPKIREVATAVEACPPGVRIVEAHPEVCFRAMAGAAMLNPKRTAAGRAERLAALERARVPFADLEVPRTRCLPDDVVDAHACLWTARRVTLGHAETIGAADDDSGVIVV